MIVWLGNEKYEVEELISRIEFDIVSIEAIIKKLLQYKELKVSSLKMLKSLSSDEPI